MSQINKVRLYKKVYLPFELVGVDSGKPTNAYYNLSKESAIQWSFMMERENTKITNREYKIWQEFVQQLRQREIVIIMDFGDYTTLLQKINSDNTILLIDQGNKKSGTRELILMNNIEERNLQKVVFIEFSEGYIRIEL